VSKSNRLKGKYNPELNIRMRTSERTVEMASRKEGLSAKHTPEPKHNPPKKTKVQRKESKAFVNSQKLVLNNRGNSVKGKLSKSERGYAFIMGIILPACMPAEQV
jgi:hypothetical protein